MDCSDTSAAPVAVWTTPDPQCGINAAEQPRLKAATWPRLLAGATATAILLSGLNAFVQICKVAIAYGCQHGR